MRLRQILQRIQWGIIALLTGLMFSAFSSDAQQPIQPLPLIAPPADYSQTCQSEPILFERFGPYCLNPIFWDVPELGLQRIGSWVFFSRDDGSSRS